MGVSLAVVGWLLGVARAGEGDPAPAAPTPSTAARVVSGVGVGVGLTGAGLTALAYRDWGWESYTGVVFATFGLPTLAAGVAMTAGGTCAQAVRLRARKEACGVSLGLLGVTAVGAALWVPVNDDGPQVYPVEVMIATGVAGWAAALVQGAVNRPAGSRSVSRVLAVPTALPGPRSATPGLALVGRI